MIDACLDFLVALLTDFFVRPCCSHVENFLTVPTLLTMRNGPGAHYRCHDTLPCCIRSLAQSWPSQTQYRYYLPSHATEGDECFKRECSARDPPQSVPSCWAGLSDCTPCNSTTTTTGAIPETGDGPAEEEDPSSMGILVAVIAGSAVVVIAAVAVGIFCLTRSNKAGEDEAPATTPEVAYTPSHNDSKACVIAHEVGLWTHWIKDTIYLMAVNLGGKLSG